MKRLAIILLAFTLTACGTTKKLTNRDASKEATKVEQSTATASELITKNKTTVTEKVDTSVKVPGSGADLITPADKLMKGDTVTETSGPTTIAVVYDRNTGNIHAWAKTEPQEVPVYIDRTTTTETETKASTEQKTAASVETERTHENEFAQIERKTGGWWSGFKTSLWLLLLVCVLVALWRFRKLLPF